MNETKLFVLRPAFQVTDCPEHLHVLGQLTKKVDRWGKKVP